MNLTGLLSSDRPFVSLFLRCLCRSRGCGLVVVVKEEEEEVVVIEEVVCFAFLNDVG